MKIKTSAIFAKILIITVLAISQIGLVSAQGSGCIFKEDTVNIQITDCNLGFQYCVEDVPLDSVSSYEVKLDGQNYSGIFTGCDFDTVSAYNYKTLFGQGNLGPYELKNWMVNGVNYTTTFNSINELVTFMNASDPMGFWIHDPVKKLIIGGNPQNTYTLMEVNVVVIQSPSYIGYNIGFKPRGIVVTIPSGTHLLTIKDNIHNCSDSLYFNIQCQSTQIDTVQVYETESIDYCVDLTKIPNATSLVNFCPNNSGDNSTVSTSSPVNCIKITGLLEGWDMACLALCDANGKCDTTLLYIQVLPKILPDVVHVYVAPGDTITVCPDLSDLNGPIVTVFNACPNNTGTFSSVLQINSTTGCVDILGLKSGGPEKICLVYCDATGVCDTTTYFVHVLNHKVEVIFDTVLINFSNSVCLDLTQFTSPGIKLQNLCPGSSGTYTSATVDTVANCLLYTGKLIGSTDTFCLVGVDSLGNKHEITVYVTVIPPHSEILYDTIKVGDSKVLCPSKIELKGNNITIMNICPNQSGTNTSFTIDQVTLCVTANGLSVGTDTACLVICDDLGVCDTLTWIVTVKDSGGTNIMPPVAVDDHVTTSQNTSIIIIVTPNDTVRGEGPIWQFLPQQFGGSGPLHGKVQILSNGSYNYTPDKDYCGPDQFTYYLCTSTGCDTAVVFIDIECKDELVIYNGFSPNKDNSNEVFFIKGLNKYPDNQLCVYNRWGHRIFAIQNYQNDWDGTWDSKALPDGTYYYVLFLDKDKKDRRCGYLQIHR